MGAFKFCKTWKPARRAVPTVLAASVPVGSALNLGFSPIERIYRVNVPGYEERTAAVASLRKEAERRKYVTMVAPYTRAQTAEAVCLCHLGGKRGNLRYGRTTRPMVYPNETEPNERESVTVEIPTPLMNYDS
jgi:hypothetical protein